MRNHILAVCLLSVPVLLPGQTLPLTEYTIPTSPNEPFIMTVGPDGAIWFIDIKGNNIGRITTAGVITRYPVPTAASSPEGIVVGPDGALWFTELSGNKVGRITTAGAITEYPIPTPPTGPNGAGGITLGQDGALWFTEVSAGKIARITTAGQFTEFPLPTTGSNTVSIVSGPDGALWFAESQGNNIGRITTAGVITEYTLPLPASGPFFISPGPDGALWFTESWRSKIGRITTAGVITEYALPAGTNSGLGPQPFGITTGPDGALWFTEFGGNRIGRITTGGAITEYPPLPNAMSLPTTIITGPDSALWFSEDVGRIGRAAPSIPYYFSDLVFAGGFQSTFTLINYSPQSVTCTTNFYSDSGVALSVPFSNGAVSTRTDVLPPGGSVHDQTVASLTNATTQGWAQSGCTGSVEASLLYRYYTNGVPTSEAGVNAEIAPTTTFVTFAETSTGVAFGNPSTAQSATISLALYNTTGAKVGSKTLTLGPLQHTATNPAQTLGLSNFTGSIQITSTIPIVSLSLNAESFPVISSLPPGDLPGGLNDGGGPTNYYFSDLAFAGGFQTTLTLINYSSQSITCTTDFYSNSGGALLVPFSKGTTSTRIDVLPPGGSVHDQTVAMLTDPSSEGWAQSSCTGPVKASLLYRYYTNAVPTSEAAVNAETAPTTEVATFAETSTGVAYANPSSTQSATITFTVFNSAGLKLGTQAVTLGPLAHGAANVGQMLGLTSFTGFLRIVSDKPIVSLSLNAEAFPVISSLPPGDLPVSTTLVP